MFAATIKSSAAAAVAIVTLFAAQAPAAAAGLEIRHADLDLTTPAGQQELKQRIDRAAAKFCSEPVNMNTGTRLSSSACRSEVVAQASAQAEKLIAKASARTQTAALNGSAPAAP